MKKVTALVYIFISFLFLVSSCSTKTVKIIWVNSVKTICDTSEQCLSISENENLDAANWEIYKGKISGFSFEKGTFQKLKVEQIPNPEKSNFDYKVISVLETVVDQRAKLQGDWTIVKLNNHPINKKYVLPTLNIDFNTNRISGNDGCNNYTSTITSSSNKTFKISAIANTKKMCPDMTISEAYLKALETVTSYQLENEILTFYNATNTPVLAFIKLKSTSNITRLNDIWNLVRLNGNPINRKVKTPRLEINTSKNTILGTNGCNDYTGTITTITDSTLVFGTIAITSKICKDMEIANAYNTALANVNWYTFNQLKLTLYNAEKKELLTFLKGD